MIKSREDIIGKTITGVITRPARRGCNPSVVMLQFSDGSYFEFVSPGALRSLGRAVKIREESAANGVFDPMVNEVPQLAISGV